jgi:hypothetical protein
MIVKKKTKPPTLLPQVECLSRPTNERSDTGPSRTQYPTADSTGASRLDQICLARFVTGNDGSTAACERAARPACSTHQPIVAQLSRAPAA